jgi:hypothetical protein
LLLPCDNFNQPAPSDFISKIIIGATVVAHLTALMVGVMGNDLRRGCNDIAELLRSERFI